MKNINAVFKIINKKVEALSDGSTLDLDDLLRTASKEGIPLYVVERLLATAYNRENKIPTKTIQPKPTNTENSIDILNIGEILPKSSEFLIKVKIGEKGQKEFEEEEKFNLSDYASESDFVDKFSGRIGNSIVLNQQQKMNLRTAFLQRRTDFKKREQKKKLLIGTSIGVGLVLLVVSLVGAGVFKNTEERVFDSWINARFAEIECIKKGIKSSGKENEIGRLNNRIEIILDVLDDYTSPLAKEHAQNFETKLGEIKSKLINEYNIEISECEKK